MNIHNLTKCSLFLEFYMDENCTEPIAIATGFTLITKTRRDIFLVTNWHCVTGIHPDTKKPLSANGLSHPEIMKVYFHEKNKLGNWIPVLINLIDEHGNKNYIEHSLGSEVDVVAIRISPNENIDVFSINDSIVGKFDKEVSDPCSIVGFPVGIAANGKFPIWKTGNIATDIDIPWDNKKMFLIDATTRKGMSGSPVYCLNNGVIKNGEVFGLMGRKQLNFLGVYAGRLDETTELGRVWKLDYVQDIIDSYYKNKSSKSSLFSSTYSLPTIKWNSNL